MLKKLAIVAVIVVLLFAAGVFFIFSQIDSLTKRAIEEGGTYALEVPVTVESADLTLSDGSLDLVGLRVANPSGFGTAEERFVSLGTGGLVLDAATLQDDVVRVPSIRLADIDMLLIKDGSGSNYQRILDSLKRFEKPAEGEPAPAPADPADPAAPGQRIVIDEILLTNINVQVRYLSGLPGVDGLSSLDVPIDQIRLENVGEDPDNPVDLNDTVSIVMKALLAAVVEKAGGVLPPDFTADLEASLAQLASLSDMGVGMAAELGADAQEKLEEVGRQVEQQLGEVSGEVGRALDGATREAGEAAGRIGGEIERGIGGLIPGRGGNAGDGGDAGGSGG
jgi:hypothetical protein